MGLSVGKWTKTSERNRLLKQKKLYTGMGEEVIPELTKEYKFNNCSFRSDDEDTKLIRTCSCPNMTELKGYHCSVHSLFPLNMDFCGFCKDFKQK